MEMHLNTVYGSGAWDEKFSQSVLFRPGESENRVVNLYPEAEYQTFEGFGGAITEAAGYVYAQMNDEEKKTLMQAYFSPEGMNYQFVRIPIDSCDFSLGPYEGFARVEKYIIPMLRDAEKAHGSPLGIMLAPWSPPAKWKTNGIRQYGGSLKREYYADYAAYLCDHIEWYRSQGFSVTRLSLQNEAHAVQTWDSCVWTAGEQKEFLRDYMYPEMIKRSLADIEIYLWDHNKERVYEWLRDVVDDDTNKMVAGIAFHWYSGDHFEALDLCREKYPAKKLMISESCIEYYKFDVSDAFGAAEKFSHEIIGDLNHGMVAFGDWNILLDENGGPNYVGNYCLAPFMYDTRAHKLTETLLGRYVEVIAKAIPAGSVRIAATKYSDSVDVTAWKRPDGKTALVMLNRSKKNSPVCVRLNGGEADAVLWPESITSAIVE